MLAIGIVVDDAIVVVEAVEHHIEHGMAPRDATIRAMEEVSGPVIAIGLVLTAVFVPCAFISGIVGQFFRQFALTIATSTIISAFNSLTLSPALAALLLQPRATARRTSRCRGWRMSSSAAGWARCTWPLARAARDAGLDESAGTRWAGLGGPGGGGRRGRLVGWLAGRPLNGLLGGFFRLFNAGFNRATNVYTPHRRAALAAQRPRAGGLRRAALPDLRGVRSTPKGFIPSQDMGYLMINVQLPDSASAERTVQVMDRLEAIAHATPGVKHTQGMSGQSLLLSAFGSNFGSMFVILDSFDKRPVPLTDRAFRLVDLNGIEYRVREWLKLPPKKPDLEERVRKRLKMPKQPSLYSEDVANELRKRFTAQVPEATLGVFGPPPIRGVGRSGGYKMLVEDRGDVGMVELQKQTEKLVERPTRFCS